MKREVLTVEAYAAEIAALLAPSLPTRSEIVALDDSLGRVLAEPVVAVAAVPPFANSAMDGYAVLGSDVSAVPTTLSVISDVPAGCSADPAFGPGECVRIMTGAPVPSAADTVVPVELTDGGISSVTITGRPKLGGHIRAAGEDFAAGQVLAEPGRLVTPAAVAAVAAAGVSRVAVRVRPRVGVIVTGDELVAPGQPLARGQIYESNGAYLAAALRRDGAEATVRWVPDESNVLQSALSELAATCDFLIISGGASVGSFDVARDVLWSQPRSAYRTVLMQPGKPQGWAVWGETQVVSVPGNPMSTAISYEIFIRPLLGAARPDSVALAGANWVSPAGRRQFVPVRLTVSANGHQVATPAHVRGSASHLVTSLMHADALAMVPDVVTEVSESMPLVVRRLNSQ